MATTTAIAYDILARDRGASSTLNRLGDSAERAGKRTDRAGRLVKAGAKAMAVGIGGAAVVAFRFAEAAASDEVGATKMARAFRNSAGATRVQIAATEAWITKQGLALGVTDDELRPALTRLVASTENVGKAQRLASLAMDVSVGRGKSLQAVTEALAKGNDGNVSGLARLGVKTKDASGKTLEFDQIVKNLSETFKGQAAGAADTTSGKYERVKIAFSEAGEALGYKLMGPLTDMATWLAGTGIPTLDKFTTALGDKVGTATDTVSGKVQGMLKAFDGLQDMNGDEIGRNIASAVGSGIEQLGDLGGTIFDKLDDAFGDVDWVGLGISAGKQVPSLLLGLVAGILNFDIGGMLSGVGDHWFEILIGLLTVAFAPAKLVGKVAELLGKIPLAGRLISWMLTSINGVGGRFKSFGGELIGWFSSGFSSALGRTGPGLLGRVGGFISSIPGRVGGLAASLGSRLSNAMRAAFLSAGEAAGRGVSRVVEYAGRLPSRMLSAVKGIGSTLTQSGRNVVQGFVNGLTDNAVVQKIISAAKGLADKIPGPIKKILRISSPSRLMMELGGFVTEGLARGIVGPKSRKLDAAIKRTVDKVAAIKDKLSSLIGDRDSFASGMNFSTSVFGADYGDSGPTVSGIIAKQQGEASQAEQIRAAVAKLIQSGLSDSLLTQLQGAGASGIPTLLSLASGTQQQIGQLNALDAATQASYGAAGMQAGNAKYGAEIAKTTNELKGHTVVLKELRDLNKIIANSKNEIVIKLEGKDIVYSINKYNADKGKKK